jgi:hypothetical protein
VQALSHVLDVNEYSARSLVDEEPALLEEKEKQLKVRQARQWCTFVTVVHRVCDGDSRSSESDSLSQKISVTCLDSCAALTTWDV